MESVTPDLRLPSQPNSTATPLVGTHFPSRWGYEAELAWVACYIPRRYDSYCQGMFTHNPLGWFTKNALNS